jgi:hypothetical protein
MRFFVRMLLMLVFITMLGCATPGKKAIPPTKESLAGEWFGITENDLYAYLFRLSKSGEASVKFSFLDYEPKSFRIKKWDYDPNSLTIVFSLDSKTENGIEKVSCRVQGDMLFLHLTGKDWNEQVRLRKADSILTRIQNLRSGE